jgi:hypothetical protein
VAARTANEAQALGVPQASTPTESIIVGTVEEVLPQASVLIALAAIVYVLGPRSPARPG